MYAVKEALRHSTVSVNEIYLAGLGAPGGTVTENYLDKRLMVKCRCFGWSGAAITGWSRNIPICGMKSIQKD